MAVNDFNKTNFRRVMSALLFSMMIIVVLIVAFVYVTTHPSQPQYYATSIQGRINPIVPLDQPNLPPSSLLQWANEAAIASYTFDFQNYGSELQAASIYYTPTGFSSFISAMRAHVLPTVIAKKVILSAVSTGAPVILEQGEREGVYTWTVQMPMLVSYQSASQLKQQPVMITMQIQRVSTLSYYRGVGISSLLTQ